MDYEPQSWKHKHQERILEAINHVADSEGLRYWLSYGSVLGAVRHGGFIPWDPDADVCIPVPDYDAFREGLRRTLPEEYVVQDGETENGYGLLFSRVGLRDGSQGQAHVDLFPLGGAPTRQPSLGLFLLALRITNVAYLLKKTNLAKQFEARKTKRRAALSLKILIWPIPVRTIERIYSRLRLFRDFDHSDRVVNLAASWGLREVFARRVFGGEHLPFESMTLRVPDEPELYLSQMYGDYLTPKQDSYIENTPYFRNRK